VIVNTVVLWMVAQYVDISVSGEHGTGIFGALFGVEGTGSVFFLNVCIHTHAASRVPTPQS
jgi:hypothetical protein